VSELDGEILSSATITVEIIPGGAPGLSAYQLDVAAGRFVGTEAEWAEWIHGADGAPGPTAVSVDEGNAATLGEDGLIFVPEVTGGASNWGDLGGTLADQGDLQDALDAKADSADLGTAAAADAVEFASAAQGALADSAVQPGDIGTAAAEDSTAFASAAQGALADSAVQPDDPIAISQLDVTGTPDGSKFLRDDGVWAAPPGGGGGSAPEVRHSNDGTYDYTGTAANGTAEGSSGWTVTRITLTSPPVVMTGSGTWTGRAGLSYS
jgi:hypothetical protein